MTQVQPIRTSETMTAGIVNTPLTYPAKIFFIHPTDDIQSIESVYTVLETNSINFERYDISASGMTIIRSISQVQPKTIKLIFRNFRTLRPKLDSDYRYPFWEIDTKDDIILYEVLNLYKFLRLPVYVHESMQGYHFVCVKPILKEKYSWFIKQVRHTNEKYPPITLRILPNKYIHEENTFYEGFIQTEFFHSDTERVKYMIENREIEKLQQYYQIVWYSFDKKQEVVIS